MNNPSAIGQSIQPLHKGARIHVLLYVCTGNGSAMRQLWMPAEVLSITSDKRPNKVRLANGHTLKRPLYWEWINQNPSTVGVAAS